MKNEKTNLGVSWFSHHKLETQSIIDALVEAKKYASGNLLDVGCGNKPYYTLFSSNVSQYFGVDVPYYPPSKKNVDVLGDFERLPFKSESFDTLLCTQVLEYIPHPQDTMKEALRILKPGGYFILTAAQDVGFGEKNDYFRFTKNGLKILFEESGFEIKYIKTRGGFWALIGHAISNHIYYLVGCRLYILLQFPNAVLQLFFFILDKINPSHENTLGYIAVARKK